MSSFSGILGAKNQYGRWVPEQELNVKAIAGGSTVDFSQALFKYKEYTIYTKAFWGGVTVIVPPGVTVEQNGQAILGGFGGNGGVYSSATTGPAAAWHEPLMLRRLSTTYKIHFTYQKTEAESRSRWRARPLWALCRWQ
eukprot:symbB.v1.2.029594.t1/scaffold3261.1/size60078/2